MGELNENQKIIYDKISEFEKGLTVKELCDKVFFKKPFKSGIYHKILPICNHLEKKGFLKSEYKFGRRKTFQITKIKPE